MSGIVLGVDGGGTWTRVLLARVDGEELARSAGAPALVDPTRPEASADAVAAVCREAADAAGVELPITALWAGIAGARGAGVCEMLGVELGRRGLAERVGVGTDADAAYHDAFGDGPGILLISGTGSVALGKREDGSSATVGGWGVVLGDEGSGFAIGMAALRSIVRGVDGRSMSTSMKEDVLERLGLDRPEELVSWVARSKKSDVAGLVPIVCRAAGLRDPVAETIVEGAVEDLTGHVLTLVRRLGPWTGRPSVALSGGLLGEGGPLRDRTRAALAGLLCQPIDRLLDPARGAARLAARLLESG
ncbi:MAG: BadF/BadG/BcrA/BcrD ATPase family protein [Gemmatimonadota bacterium]|nr:MAG: BadF/BadG/BcrA/BcrD ATPase family protein [Gemmatimonadota bacterium]